MKLRSISSLISLISIFLILSCAPQSEELEEFGPQASSDEVNDELTKGLSGVNVLSMEVGDFIHRLETSEFTTADGQQELISAELGYNVLDMQTIDNIRRYTLVREIIDYTGDEVQKNTFESEIEFDLSEFVESSYLKLISTDVHSRAENLLLEHTRKAKNQFIESSKGRNPLKTMSESEIQVTYHNLKSKEIEIDVPARVLERDQCGGVPSCKLNVLYITYDEILRNDESAERYRNEYYFSNDIPFSPFDGELNLLKQCLTGIGKIGTSRLLVKQCTSVVDFRHGVPEE